MQATRTGNGARGGAMPGAWSGAGGRPQPKTDYKTLWRAIRYIGNYRWLVFLAYASLFVATAAQLVVPQLVQNIIDTITSAYAAGQVLALPPAQQAGAAQSLGKTVAELTATYNGTTTALILGMVAIVGFAILLGIFSFVQSFNAERVSQNVAYDFRNQLYAKIQRLSFSYHDRNQTGQLMIRATDDVEKVRLFIGQGLVLALASVVLLVAALVILWFTNVSLTLVILPVLPIAFAVFLFFGKITQPLFIQVQIRISAMNTVLQENLAGLKVVKAFAREPQEQVRFRKTTNDLLAQQLRVAGIFSFLFPVIFLLANLAQAAILYFGGVQIINGTLTL